MSSSIHSNNLSVADKIKYANDFLDNIEIGDSSDEIAIDVLKQLLTAYQKKNEQVNALMKKKREENIAKGLNADGSKKVEDLTDEEILAKAKAAMAKLKATMEKKKAAAAPATKIPKKTA